MGKEKNYDYVYSDINYATAENGGMFHNHRKLSSRLEAKNITKDYTKQTDVCETTRINDDTIQKKKIYKKTDEYFNDYWIHLNYTRKKVAKQPIDQSKESSNDNTQDSIHVKVSKR